MGRPESGGERERMLLEECEGEDKAEEQSGTQVMFNMLDMAPSRETRWPAERIWTEEETLSSPR